MYTRNRRARHTIAVWNSITIWPRPTHRGVIGVFDALTVLWAVIGAGIVLFALVWAWSSRRGSDDASLGTVSDHWLAEQRLNRPDSQR